MYSIFMHGRSSMAIDPRMATMPGRSTSGFHQPGKGVAGGYFVISEVSRRGVRRKAIYFQ